MTSAATEGGSPDSLAERLRLALPKDFHCFTRYVHTPAKRCDPLFSPPAGQQPEHTRLASHFLAVSIDAGLEPENGSLDHSGQSLDKPDVMVLGIEALEYTTGRLTTLFVSKADSTGYLPASTPSPTRTIVTTFLRWLSDRARRRRPSKKLVISLFARAQSQYLFPGSAENAKKHVLDDRQLIRWWARVLDPLFPSHGNDGKVSGEASDQTDHRGYITVPGYDGQTELRTFLPADNRSPTTGSLRWTAGNPLEELAEDRGIPSSALAPRCVLPRFPDDPKARFMQDLDEEAGIADETSSSTTASPSKKKGGHWNSIRSLARFWEAMEFRQECSSGRVVGFLWLVVAPKETVIAQREQSQSSHPSFDLSENRQPRLTTAANHPLQAARGNTASTHEKHRKPLRGPVVPRQPRLKGGASSISNDRLSPNLGLDAADDPVLSQDGYDKAMHALLHLDFANLDVAAKSTKKWASEVASICSLRKSDVSVSVVGTAEVDSQNFFESVMPQGNLQVNDLVGMVKKKRKVEDANAGKPKEESGDTAGTGVNVLSAGLVRKKPKPASN